MSDEVVEIVGGVEDLEDGQYVFMSVYFVKRYFAYACV